ncbi:HNH endonuclease [Alkalihalophilus lindianensis]|uniref:Putative HNH nuclease YajD n=1 Tax=Alkalihalophilus lindianensis TaxID=1630542 RepID=A0ABU3XBB7_9BACI|nr:HNH endonuclease [Alkalihalophilus lindianensis]MDV2685180.1 HNH endonuclease [Alkalihalophilus lindianensis]
MSVEYKTEEQKKKFYRSKSWEEIRQEALERDNYECQECKRQGRVHVDSKKEEGKRKSIELNVHHKYEIEYYPKLALVLDNLETLCLNCHNKIHGKGFKKKKPKWDDEKW